MPCVCMVGISRPSLQTLNAFPIGNLTKTTGEIRWFSFAARIRNEIPVIVPFVGHPAIDKSETNVL